MKPFKNYIAEQLIGKKLYFECDCMFPIKKVGTIKSYKIYNNEIVYFVDIDGKTIRIGENHPNLKIKEV